MDDDWTPLASAPYGTMSEFFDPTAMDEGGNGLLRFYPAGPNGSDDRPMSQSFTLGAGDTYGVFVTTSGPPDGGFGRDGDLRSMMVALEP